MACGDCQAAVEERDDTERQNRILGAILTRERELTARLVEALAFYADERNHDGNYWPMGHPPMWDDDGQKARDALAAVKAGQGHDRGLAVRRHRRVRSGAGAAGDGGAVALKSIRTAATSSPVTGRMFPGKHSRGGSRNQP